jgi:vacuolar-type H+-ATPase subunit I/STV1
MSENNGSAVVKTNCTNEKCKAIIAEMVAAGKSKTDWLVYMVANFNSSPDIGDSVEEYWNKKRTSSLAKLKAAKMEVDKGNDDIRKKMYQDTWNLYQFKKGKSKSTETDPEILALEQAIAKAKEEAERIKSELAEEKKNSAEAESAILAMLTESPVV